MKTAIDFQNIQFTFTFTPAEYFLVYDKKTNRWSLNGRIDRSEKGKEDDVADVTIYVDDSATLEEMKKYFTVVYV